MSRLAALGAVLGCACGRFGFENRDAAPGDAATSTDTLDAASGCGFVFGAGRQHLAAVFPDGTARVWGDGAYGQIGDGFMYDRNLPTAVSLPARVVSVGGGRYETCAALETGVVYCWGEGDSGQLGDGNGTTSTTPVAVADVTSFVEVAPAAIHACGRTSSGDVYCWGAGGSGRLGNGGTSSSLLPKQTTIANVKRVMAGGSTTCAILTDDSPRCWGYNQEGGCGVNSMTDVLSPMQPVGVATVRAILSRDISTCAVRGDGNVFCWGGNAVGQCGTTPVGSNLLVPNQVVLMSGVALGSGVDVGMGIEHGCALLEDHTVWCWGRNQYGQLGNGMTSTSAQPYATKVIGLPEIEQIGIAAWTSCGLARDGGVWCWGYGPDGELGDGTFTAMQPTPALSFTVCP